MKRSLQNAPFIFAALLAVIAAMAHAQSAAPVLLAKFVGTLNTKAAKAGDAVVAITEKPAKMADGKEIPKGSLITGRVAGVKSKNDGNGNSGNDGQEEEVTRAITRPNRAALPDPRRFPSTFPPSA